MQDLEIVSANLAESTHPIQTTQSPCPVRRRLHYVERYGNDLVSDGVIDSLGKRQPSGVIAAFVRESDGKQTHRTFALGSFTID
jgi:hypothetical protein